ncbi:nicotinate dehydrogenase subunit A [Mesorhizobium albiziae]|uniref:Nicotinate dehydrogenase subunit A n=1 Tax=Neomesorhizobium albiziae TaxID=335020 RepID=A0A1I4BY90_9HYPH|nr:(2Fe-2S)-binding protein [Mesorhizobium albiziae]GLS29600.1 oxidoreductase [Mesorhizobium albiziae]SFK73615.1 nicotinate dehydrogenase subunit A [Mesorhizobium albiziae]
MALFTLTVNGRQAQVECEGDTPLLYVLRNDLALNGPKYGCGLGQCGACTVLMEGQPIRSCITPVADVGETPVTTLEGIADGDKLHPLQTAFIEEQALQCGYCTNGMIMTAKALLDTEAYPDEASIKQALSTNLCRCGVHNRIVKAVRGAAQKMGQ